MTGKAPRIKRQLQFGDHGQDVKIVQRALHRALGKNAKNKKNGKFGAATVGDMIRFQRAHGIQGTGDMGQKTWNALWPWVNAPDAKMMKAFKKPPVLSEEARAQQAIVRAAYWFIAHSRTIKYAQTRPIPYYKMDTWNPRILTDCSGSVSMHYYSAGAPDPNGQGYNGLGYTGTLRANGRWVRRPYQIGDLLHYGGGQGKHVCEVLDPEDDVNFSFGSNPPRLVRRLYRGDFVGATRHALVG